MISRKFELNNKTEKSSKLLRLYCYLIHRFLLYIYWDMLESIQEIIYRSTPSWERHLALQCVDFMHFYLIYSCIFLCLYFFPLSILRKKYKYFSSLQSFPWGDISLRFWCVQHPLFFSTSKWDKVLKNPLILNPLVF